MPDARYMDLALRLARKGRGYVNPNPMVGAVIVKNGSIVGKGYHKKFGGPHAEVNAIKEAGRNAKGALLYVTLEPCCHFGKTPPCTHAIIRAGIKKVVIAAVDPNPLNNGRGIRELKKTGITVRKGIMKKEAEILNEKFFTYHKRKRPFVSVKCAMTLDGKIATVRGDSRWISGKKARRFAHLLRHEHDAVMVGVNTVATDNPRLTARYKKDMRKPSIIVLDTNLSIPLNARIIKNARKSRIIIAAKISSGKNRDTLLSKGAEILTVKSKSGRVNLADLLKKLCRMGITSILAEGGGEIIYSLLSERLVDKLYFFYSPKILGGRRAPTAVQGEGIRDINKAIAIRDASFSRIGEDFLLTGYPQ